MGVSFHVCEESLDKAVDDLFDCDPQIQAVGIARHEAAFGFKAVKNAAKVVPVSTSKATKKPPKVIKKVPVTIESVTGDIQPNLIVPCPMVASFIPEQQRHRLLLCGLQLQNVDDDDRQRKAGNLDPTSLIVGSLGCFVRLAGGASGMMSNNHVLAGENRGKKGRDRILQPGGLTFTSEQCIAKLIDFVDLLPSPNTARPAMGNVKYNEVDAAVAELAGGTEFTQGYLPSRHLPGPHDVTTPKVGDKVFKVGRTTGLTRGTITAVGIVVGPIPYAAGHCGSTTSLRSSAIEAACFPTTAIRARQS